MICLRFPMVAPGISEGVCHFDVARGTLKCRVGTLVWPSGTLNKSSWTYSLTIGRFRVSD